MRYAIVVEEVTVSAAQDLLEINAPSDAVVELESCVVTQSSDAGDSEAEMLPILIHRASTSGSGGSTVTPSPLEVGDAAFGGTVEANNTTQGTEGTFIHAEAFNVQVGFYYMPPPEHRPVISPSGRLVVELQSNPADALTVNIAAVIRQIGG